MFYCEACRIKNGWPKSLSNESYGPCSCLSYGPCECCDKIGLCHDGPSYSLPLKPAKAKSKGTKKRKH